VAVFLSAPTEFGFQPAPFAPQVGPIEECSEKADGSLLNLRCIDQSLDDGGTVPTQLPLTEQQCETIIEIVSLDKGRNSADVIRRSAGFYSIAIENALLGKSLYFLTIEQATNLPETSDAVVCKIG
jgi:hypothetical protein